MIYFINDGNTRSLRMTKQEVKDEHKSTEGDPTAKQRLRKVRVECAQRRMMQAVPDADVVVTNPTHFAVAMKYNPEDMSAGRCCERSGFGAFTS